ncbi:hypothetical protein ACWDWS_28300 [Streptomyces sp. NPDC003328]|uniref:hypothetical protein n=1 Tax=unclassified Streptomyces TaxID=2593676 RepID=UPI0033BEE3A6
MGDLDPGARLLKDSSGLTRALAGQIGPFFHGYARPGELQAYNGTPEAPQVAWCAQNMAVRLILMTGITRLS